MPKISQENKQYYKSRIRGILAQDHQISQRALQERLKVDGIVIDRKYLGSLLNAIYVERTKRIDTMTLSAALSGFQDTMTEVVRKAWDIANDPFAENNEVLGALREIRAAHNDVFEKLFDAGVFDRKLGSLEMKIRNTPLPEPKKQAIRSVFAGWGLLPAPKEDAQPTNANPYNEHVTFHNFLKRVCEIPGELKGANIFFVEDVGYQKAAIQEMERALLPVVPMKPTTDKRSRLQVVAPYIKNGIVQFPRSGCEQLLGQIFNLGVESHDDLCDGLVWLLQGLVSQGLELPKIQWIEG
jgi:hypothetical protein